MNHLLTDTVTVLTYSETATEDRYGNAVPAWTAGSSYRARLEQVDASERTDRENTQVTEWRLFLPADAIVSGADRISYDAREFEVVGEPAYQRTPRGVHHVEVRLRRAV